LHLSGLRSQMKIAWTMFVDNYLKGEEGTELYDMPYFSSRNDKVLSFVENQVN